MDSSMLQDEGVRNRIRQAAEFLEPGMPSMTARTQLAADHTLP